MRNAFAQARRLAPSILFIDEIDGISDRATLKGDYVEYWSQIVNLFLELLAGIEDRPGVVVVAATNHPDKIDEAVRRAGRLDRTITIEKPDVEDLVGIVRFHLKDDLTNADLLPVALAARGGTGADLEAWVRRAK
jgi:SpoVK/Ycf46/Vps4 family AAA+-type ATPase